MINFPIDFPMTEPSIMTSVYCILMYSICVLYSYRLSTTWNIVTIKRLASSSVFVFTSFIGFFFVTNCINGDFYHAMEKVHEYRKDSYYYSGEPIYQEIITLVNNNYLLFRTIVWGGAFAVFCMSARRLKIPIFFAVSVLCISYSILFCYARATAAMAVYFYGLTYLCRPIQHHKWLGYVVGLLLIYSSWSFHTSAIIMILMTFVLFLPVKKWSITAMLIAIPITALYLKDYFFLLALDEGTDEYLSQKMLNYSEREVVTGIASQIISLLRYASIYIPLFFCYKSIISKNNKVKMQKEQSELLLFKVSFGLVYISTTFLFFGDTFYTFFYRILNMAMIPIALLLSKLYIDKRLSNRVFLFCILIGIASQVMHYSYTIYLNR